MHHQTPPVLRTQPHQHARTRMDSGRFVHDGCCADLFIVLASFMEYIQFAVQSLSTLNPKILRVLRVFRAVRAVRALRVLRTISFLKNLQVIVSTLLTSIPGMGAIILLLFLVSCECARAIT